MYGNNGAMLQQVAIGMRESVCNGLPVDYLNNLGIAGRTNESPIRILYIGPQGPDIAKWFVSPELTRMSDDFSRLAFLDFETALALLVRYDVRVIVVDLRKPYDVPRYDYQGTALSPFFVSLWSSHYPVYQSENIAVFQIG